MSAGTPHFTEAAVKVDAEYPHHPLGPLSAKEISASAHILRAAWPENTGLHFKTITLSEPSKAESIPYLVDERAGKTPTPIDRRSFVVYYLRGTDNHHEAIVNITQEKVESNIRLGPNNHSNGDFIEIMELQNILSEDESVKAELAKLKLPEGAVVVNDTWIYGSDGDDDDKRMFQCYFYLRDPNNPGEVDGNHYAMPLPLAPVVDAVSKKVIRIDILPTGADGTIKETSPYKVQPPNEYIPEAQTLRTDLKPLHVLQPEGVSFKVTETSELGRSISWQKWDFKVGFNQREGMVLYDVHYDGRQLFYRLSLSEMSVPYGDPRAPFHRKAAFDLGDAGAGITANNLKLGCDCLGSIQYLSTIFHDDNANPFALENVMCIHEQDAGIGWKHTNYRTQRPVVTRARELVIQSILTVGNYEYILAFQFDQAGAIMYEVRATGILSTQPIDDGVTVPWGTVVHPGVLAPVHQHLFSLRVDPMIDGQLNSVAYTDVKAMPRSEFNPHGIGYTAQDTIITQSGGYDLDDQLNRAFKIQNSAVKNPINGKSVAYKIHAPPFQKILSDKESFNYKRAEFADHNIYVTTHSPDELFAGGKYTNQSRGGKGVRSWADRKDNVEDQDIVVWVQFGINHVPRIEDFPVMPAEILKVSLKPNNFFTKSPAIDVPPSTQLINQSSLVTGEGRKAETGEESDACCAQK